MTETPQSGLGVARRGPVSFQMGVNVKDLPLRGIAQWKYDERLKYLVLTKSTIRSYRNFQDYEGTL